MQPLKKTHLCVLKKYLAVAALSCAASVISVKSIAATQDLDIELTAEVPEKEFKLEKKKIELKMQVDKTNERFTGETDIRYLNHEKVQSLKVKLINHLPQLTLFKDGQSVLTDSISIESILINNKKLVNNSDGANFNQDDLRSFDQKGIPLEITSASYENAPEGNYKGTVTLQFDANI